MKFKTVRIIIERDNKYLLAQHNNWRPETIGKWGLPGGRIEKNEKFDETIRREMMEEFSIKLDALSEIGDFEYLKKLHKVFAVAYHGSGNLIFDKKEILNIKWLTFKELLEHEKAGMLHTGFEVAAVKKYRANKAVI